MATSTSNTTPSFNTPTTRTGIASVDMSQTRTIALQSDGKVVLGGWSENSSGYADFSVVRLNADGSLDSSFGGDGKAVIDVGGGSDYAVSMVVQSDGKVVLGGGSSDWPYIAYSVVRLNADGSLDSSFSGDGKAVIDVGGDDDLAHSLVVQSDGKVVLGGVSKDSSNNNNFSVVRLNADGSLDSSFSGDGKAVIAVGGSDNWANSLVVQSDGKVVLGGGSFNSSTGTDFGVVRLNADGSLDSSFGGGDGKAVIDVGGYDVATSLVVQTDGKVVLGGYSENSSGNGGDFSVVRLNADGSLDNSFGDGGKAVIDVGGDDDTAYSLVIQSDGKVVLGGLSKNSSGYSVVRLNADGSLDGSFSGDGKAVIDVGDYNYDDQAYDLVIQSDGKLVLGGNANGQGAVVRLNADGSLDTTFGAVTTGGSAVNTLGGSVAYTENAPPVILDSSVQITDAELSTLNSGAGNYAGASIILARAGGASTQDVFSGSGSLSFSGGNAVLSGTTVGTVSQANGSLTITFNSAATQALVNQTLSSIAYSNTSDAPPASVQIDWTFSDGNTSDAQGSGGALGTTGTTTVNITAVNDVHTGTVTIIGTTQKGQTLTASHTLADADGLGSIRYQWYADGSAIDGATGNTLTLTEAQAGKAIKVQARYTDSGGTSETATSSTVSVQATNTAPSFNNATPRNGFASVDMDVARTMALQSDGKVVLGGYSVSSSGSTDYSVVRLNADGSLDSSFSGDGKAVIDVGGGDDYANSLVVQSNGKVVLGGYSYNWPYYDYSVVKLTADGSLDSSFSGDGKTVIDVGRYDFAYSLVVQSDGDGKLVLGGYTDVGHTDGSYGGGFCAVRLNADGSLDSSFGDGGKAVIEVSGSNAKAFSMVVQSDGKLVLGGSIYSSGGLDFCVVRLNAYGGLDSSFGDGGKAVIDVVGIDSDDQATSLVVQSDGKVVLGGWSKNSSGYPDYYAVDTDYSVVRLNADGSLDSSFSGDGKAVIDVYAWDFANSLVVQSDGKVVLGGDAVQRYSGSTDFCVVRLNADGSLDSSFGDGGKAVIDVSGYSDSANSLVLQPDGKLILGGSAVVRLNTDGSLDTTFGAVVTGGSPVNTLGGSVAYTENAPPVILDSSVQITDAELSALDSGAGNYAGASIILARQGGASTQDVFSGSGSLSFSGGNAVLSGTTVGTVSQANGSLTITFNSAATQAKVNQTLSSIAYSNTSDAPPASVQIDWTFSDGNTSDAQGSGGALGTTGTTTVNITAVNDEHTGTVTIIGTTQKGQTLTASHTLADADGLGEISYQWYADGEAIEGTNGDSLTLGPIHVGKAISVQASYTDDLGTIESVTSGETATVSAWTTPQAGTDGPDTLTGTVGADTLNGLGGDDSLDGGAGVDTASYADATTPVSVILYGNQAFGLSSGNDTLTGIENILGSAYSDLIYGDAADNVLDGGAGNDTLDGADGNDTLLGQTGDDLLNGLAGNDSLVGRDGNDTLFGWADNDTLEGGIGTDRLFGGAGADRLDGGADADQLEGDDGADTLLGGAGNDTLRGWNDADSLDGGDGDNALFGGAGADSMQAGTGADQLEGDDGNDTIAGGAGNDTLRGWNDNDSMDGGDGNDALFGGAGSDAMQGGTGADQLEGDDGNDTITGGTGNDTLRGWNDSDSLSGDDGDDLLVGWSGNDSLVGGQGDDQLFGDDGVDTMVGGDGGDVLQGGLGNDVYVFATGYGFDGVRDYDYTEGNSDTFQFTGINLAELSFARVGDALKVERTASAGADVIYVNDWYMAGSNGAYKIETWIMGDASVFTAAQIEALV